jgi:TetR/AcrR family transcriptional regulator, regulator of cefoperazone and chloramphenicol sensitivity
MNSRTWSGADPQSQAETRRQLLEVAGGVFAEVGFRNATVREICRRAGANIAAVNYHFGDKEALYTEVLRHSQQKAFEKYPPLLEVTADAPPEEKLRAFIQSFLLRIFNSGSTAWFGKIMSREMVEPTGALDLLVEERIRPMANLLRGIVAEVLDCSPHSEKVRLCCLSVVGQCVFFHHCRTMISRLFPGQRLDASAVEQLAGHISHFSLAAMKHLPDVKNAKSKSALPRRRRH